MKGLTKKLLTVFFFLAFLTIFPIKSCLAQQVDILDYMASNAGGANIIQDHDDNLNPLGQEFFYSYFGEINPATGRESFYIVKNLDGSNFEEYNYDDQYIYRMKDTSWATGPNQDVTCNDSGDEAYFALMNGSHGPNACGAYNPSLEGGTITLRHMNVGETFGPHPLTVLGFSEITCDCCPTDYSGDITQYMTLLEAGSCSFPTGWSSSDCIKLQAGPPGAGGEVYYYARGYGFVGFEGAGMRNYIVDVSNDQPSAVLECGPRPPETDLELPPNRQTEWGDPVYGRNIPCRPLIYSQEPWFGLPWEQYSAPYFYHIGPLGHPSESGYPFDYSPWRPYPGDSGRTFYNTDGTPITDQGQIDQNMCYDLEELEKDNQITTYCNPAPEITDVIQWFPPDSSDPAALTKYYRVLSWFRAWWSDSGNRQASQIPFLGNSLTSSREFREASQRTSLFVTDFLRGTVFWDRKMIDMDNFSEYRRILDESGPIRKLFPKGRLNFTFDENQPGAFLNPFLQCRLFKMGNCGFPLLHDDPVHDYVLAWMKNVGGTVEEEEFSDLPDRREADYPLRLSAFYCGTSAEAAPFCAEFIDPEAIGWIRHEDNIGRFPLTSREDIPTFVDVSFEGVWDEAGMGGPVTGARFSDPPTIEEYYEALENPLHNGMGYHDLGEDSGLIDPALGQALPKYRFHFVDLVFLPFVVESRELGEWAGLPLTPYKLKWKEDTSVDSLQLANSGDCEINKIVRGGHGDTIGGDWRHSLDLINRYGIGREDERLLRFNNEGEEIAPARSWASGDGWGCNPDDPSDYPDRHTFSKTNDTGKIVTKIPYLKTVAKRLIGEAGVFKTLLPYEFSNLVIDKINDITDGKVFWWELPGYGPADFYYDNGLVRESVEDHWGCCPAPPTPEDPCSGCGEGGCDGPPTCPSGTRCGETDRVCHGECLKATALCCDPDGNIIGLGTFGTIEDCACSATDCRCSGARCSVRGSGSSGDGCDQIEWPPGSGEWHDAPCHCAGCAGGNCGPPVGPIIDSAGNDFRGWDEVNSEEARFYYPYIGTIDIFRKYFMNELVPGKLVKF